MKESGWRKERRCVVIPQRLYSCVFLVSLVCRIVSSSHISSSFPSFRSLGLIQGTNSHHASHSLNEAASDDLELPQQIPPLNACLVKLSCWDRAVACRCPLAPQNVLLLSTNSQSPDSDFRLSRFLTHCLFPHLLYPHCRSPMCGSKRGRSCSACAL